MQGDNLFEQEATTLTASSEKNACKKMQSLGLRGHALYLLAGTLALFIRHFQWDFVGEGGMEPAGLFFVLVSALVLEQGTDLNILQWRQL